jgi:hypothetical protein
LLDTYYADPADADMVIIEPITSHDPGRRSPLCILRKVEIWETSGTLRLFFTCQEVSKLRLRSSEPSVTHVAADENERGNTGAVEFQI